MSIISVDDIVVEDVSDSASSAMHCLSEIKID